MWCEPGEEQIFVTDAFKTPGAGLPFVVKTKGGGFAIIFYDNYLILTTSQQERDMIEARLNRNFRHLKVRVKEQATFDGISKPMDPHYIFRYLGISFVCERDRPKHRLLDSVRWRLSSREEWRNTVGNVTADSATLRLAARAIGQIICDLGVSGKPIVAVPGGHAAIALASSLGKLASRVAKGWDTSIAEEMWVKIRKLHHEVTMGADYEERLDGARVHRYQRYVITDASQEGDGWFIGVIEEGSLLLTERKVRTIPPERKEDHIYLKELRCALDALMEARSLFPFGRVDPGHR